MSTSNHTAAEVVIELERLAEEAKLDVDIETDRETRLILRGVQLGLSRAARHVAAMRYSTPRHVSSMDDTLPRHSA